MPSLQHLQEGYDPTGLVCLSIAQILQMIRAAKPYPHQGFAIFQKNAPDTVTYPELTYFIWVETADDISYIPTGKIYYYDGVSAWVDFTKLDGSRILPGTVDLAAIHTLGHTAAYDIIQVNAANTALQFVTVPNAIRTNTVPPDKLLAPDNTNSYVLTCIAGTKAFTLWSAFFVALASNTIPVDKLIRGAADTLGFYLRTKLDGSAIEWANVDVANLAAVGATAGQTIRRNLANTAWEFIPASSLAIVELTNGGAYWALPAGGAVLAVPHAVGTIPRMVNIRLRCSVSNNGYANGVDEIDLNAPIGVYASLETTPLYVWTVDATNITIQCATYSGNLPTPYFQPKAGGNSVAFDRTQWKIKVNLVA
jgi:hypothetical protein